MSLKTTTGTLLALVLSSTLPASQAAAQSQYSSITIFGDSLSDPGNIPKFFFGFNYPPPPYFENQFSNGPVYGKYLDGLFGISSSLSDFAIGGAKSGAGNIGGLPGNPTIGLPNAGIDGEISYYLQHNPRPSKTDLFIVWGGANDYFGDQASLGHLIGNPLKQYLLGPSGPVTLTVGNLVDDIRRLAAIGVRNFVIPNLPDLGATPSFNGQALTKSQGQTLASTHNQALAAAMGALQQQLHVNITIVDIGTVFSDLLANPAKYGVDPNHIADQCIQSPACVAEHQHYVFWDDVHPTGFVQQTLAEVFFATLSAPTTIGPELELEKIVQQDLFDHVSARTAALRSGAAGLTISNFGGANGTAGDADKPLSAFLNNSYGWGSRSAQPTIVGFDYNQDTVSAGVDYRLNDWSAVGMLLAYSAANNDFRDGMGSQSVSSYELAVYGTAFADGWYGTAAGTYSYNDWGKLDRNVIVGGQTAAASTSGRILGGKLEGGYVAQFGQLSIGPAIELRLADYRIGSYTEQGAVGLNQAVDGQDTTYFIGQFGLQAAIATHVGDYAVTPQFRINWDHDFRHASRAVVTRVASQLSTSMTTDIAPDASDWVRFGAGVDVRLNDVFSALVDFDTVVGREGGEDYDALARLKASF
jgi:outer membrane lipase/esterase